MTDHDMRLLDTRGVLRRYVDQEIGQILQLASRFAGQGNGDDIQFLRHLKGTDNVLGISGGGDTDKDISP